MSYLVMARKWRPKNFDEMVGQEHVARTLRNAIETNRVSHAFLFTGTRGVGKTTSARILAKCLNCAKGPTPVPCEECENCRGIASGSAMDVIEIDGASNNGVDNVRDLREQAVFAPMQGTYKIYIIDEVHMLSKSAFNALLKTLEEPPPHVVFIFATTESSKVPHTILSRVQRFDFKRISEAAIRGRLEFICAQEGLTAEPAALEALARKADGSMRDALSLFDRVYAFAGDTLTLDAARKALGIPADGMFDDLLRAVAGHDPAACLNVLNAVYEEGLEVGEFLSGFGGYLRDLLFARQPGVTPALLGHVETRFAELQNLAGDLQDGDLLRYARIVSDLIAGLRDAPHPRLWVELGLARMAALDRVVNLSQLLGQTPLPAAASHAAPAAAAATAPSDTGDPKKKSPELTAPAHPAVSSATTEATAATATVPVRTPDDEPPPPWDAPPPDLEHEDTPPATVAPQSEEDADTIRTDVDAERSTEDDSEDANAEEEGDSGDPDDAFRPRATLADEEPVAARIATGSLSPEEAPARWADLVEDYALDRPFTSSPLRHSVLRCTPGDGSAVLEVAFHNSHQQDLFLADADNRKSLRAFLAERFAPGASFTLTYTAPDSGDGESASAARAILPAESTEAVVQSDPVIRSVLELFEGRVLN